MFPAEPHAHGAPYRAYRAPLWLPGGHLQTVYGALFSPCPHVSYRRERWDSAPHGVPDGDFIDVDFIETMPGAPMLIVFHGLEGSSQSPYALALMAVCRVLGWNGMVAHFRGCSGEINRLPRAYHSGDATDIDWILRKASERASGALYAAGISLGGNALLKWLGESGNTAGQFVRAAVAISAPVDLMAGGEALGHGMNLLYTTYFLHSLKRKSLLKLRLHPGIYDATAVTRSRTLREFDSVVTAPLHGFRSTDDYWTRASSKPGLVDVRVPTLLVNALNDPFLPAQALPGPTHVSSWVSLDFPEQGGHVGFSSPHFPGRSEWLPERIFDFFRNVA
jgi:hypothetical protein